jgi:hypothetical protein
VLCVVCCVLCVECRVLSVECLALIVRVYGQSSVLNVKFWGFSVQGLESGPRWSLHFGIFPESFSKPTTAPHPVQSRTPYFSNVDKLIHPTQKATATL